MANWLNTGRKDTKRVSKDYKFSKKYYQLINKQLNL
jgi:hypothetical protein